MHAARGRGVVADSSTAGSEAYLEAFMNGFEFVLLALRGRLATEPLTKEDRKRLEAVLADYARITQAYRARREAPSDEILRFAGRLPAEVTPTMAN